MIAATTAVPARPAEPGQPVFLGILAVAVIFEISWYLARRTNAITSRPT